MTRNTHYETPDDGILPKRNPRRPISENPLAIYFGFVGLSLLFIGGVTLAALAL